MEMYIWDKYKDGEINNKIKYLLDVWEDIINNLDKINFQVSFINPQTLINDIIDEIEFNRKNNKYNKENNKLFNQYIDYYFENDLAIKSCLTSEFSLLRRDYTSSRISYLLELSHLIINSFKEGIYFRELLLKLKEVLFDESTLQDSKNIIKYISHNLIIEFVLKGYHSDTVSNFIRNIYDKYEIIKDGFITTKFPHRVNWEEYKSEERFADYNKKIIEEIENVSIAERLDYLNDYFVKEPETFYYIFYIRGLKSENKMSIGNVTFYNPKSTKYTVGPPEMQKYELLVNNPDHYFLNAIVPIISNDTKQGVTLALDSINIALDILRGYFSSEINFEIDINNYIILNQNHHHSSSSYTRSKDDYWYSWQTCINLDNYESLFSREKYFHNISNIIIKENKTSSEKRIFNSLHWYRKSEESDIPEDKILNYWISLENIFNLDITDYSHVLPKECENNKINLIIEIASHVLINSYIFTYGWDLYHFIVNLINARQGNRSLLSLPDNIITDSNLRVNKGDKIYLKKFIESIPNILKHVEREILLDKLNDVYCFYTDNTYSCIHINKMIKQFKEDLILIYRIRNMIVHNAHYDNSIINYYVQKIRTILITIIHQLISSENIDTLEIDIEQRLLSKYIFVKNLIQKYEKKINIDLLKIIG